MTEKHEILLNVENVNMNYGEKKVLRNINFQIRDIIRTGENILQGQVSSIVARSGYGKSTLFSILAGLFKPTSGKVYVGINQEEVEIGDMGVVFQDYTVYDWRKVKTLLYQAVAKNPSIYIKDRKDAITQIAEQFNLTEHLDKYPGLLSGGQKQRVAISEQVLIGNNFILLDEPFSGLDTFMIEKVLTTLIKVSTADELKTLILVSHDLPNSIAISDTVFIMNIEPGKENEGATIIKEIDLIERDLVWKPNIKEDPNFRETILEVKELMR